MAQSRVANRRLCRAGREALRTTLLTEEFTRVQLAFKARLERSGKLTIALDGRTNARGQTLYAVNVLFPDRTVHVLAVEDLSLGQHTAAYLTGAPHVDPVTSTSALKPLSAAPTWFYYDRVSERFKAWIDLVGAKKVAALVTGNAAAMKAARAGLTRTEGYQQSSTCRAYPSPRDQI